MSAGMCKESISNQFGDEQNLTYIHRLYFFNIKNEFNHVKNFLFNLRRCPRWWNNLYAHSALN